MALFKCKMCGGDLEIIEGSTVCVCEYCGTKQTVPTLDNDKKATLFQRANRLRFGCEFDKAYSVYESIIAEFPEEAEAYWGLVLCKYGVEYVDDPKTAKKIPTSHRSSFESVMDDDNFEMVMEYATVSSKPVYRAEAKEIEEIRKGIIEISSSEEPYDIFICYKETDYDGNRTLDSVIAQDVYDALTDKGYRVFFARITLEDKLGREYEPYIFSALHSSRVMLVFGTDYEYFNAVWVKNEWSRFLKLIENDKKKVLIPCFKGIDAYDMPKEFAKLQAQDMGKVGAIQDLVRGIGKIVKIAEKKTEVPVQAPAAPTGDFFAPILKRAKNNLSEYKFEEARADYKKVIDFMPDNQEAIMGLFLCEMKVASLETLANGTQFFCDEVEYARACSLNEEVKKQLMSAHESVMKNNISKAESYVQNSNFDEAKRYIENALKYDQQNSSLLRLSFLVSVKACSIDELKRSLVFFNNDFSYKKILSLGNEEIKNELKEVLEIIESNNVARINQALSDKKYHVAEQCCCNLLRYDSKNKFAIKSRLLIKCQVDKLENLALTTVAIKTTDEYAACLKVLDEDERLTIEFAAEAQITKAKDELEVAFSNRRIEEYRKLAENVLRYDPKNEKALLALLYEKYGVFCINDLPDGFEESLRYIELVDAIDPESNLAKELQQRVKYSLEVKETKRKHLNKIRNIVLAACASFLVAIISIFSLIYFPSNAYKYETKTVDGTVMITGYRGKKKDVKIPEKISGKVVTKIGVKAFARNGSIRSVVIPNGVIEIEYSAFEKCSDLETVIIPSSVDEIGQSAFANCESLKSVTISDGVESIGGSAFGYCSSLENVTIPGSVDAIGPSAFANCESLKSVTISDGVVSIGGSAFGSCSSLENVTIPGSVDAIGASAFAYCESLKSVTISDGVESIGGSAFRSCSSLENVTISGSVDTIGQYAFGSCKSLKSVTISDGVVSIGKEAFRSCSSLENVTIPGSVDAIGQYAFANCESLKSVTISDGVESIGGSAFGACSSLENVTIPGSVNSIESYAFSECRSLQKIKIPSGVVVIYYGAFGNCNILEIYCEATEKPSDWDPSWNLSRCPVVWGYTGE